MRPTSPPSKPFLFPLCFFLANFRDGLLAALFASNWSKSSSSISFGRAIRTDHSTHQSTCTPASVHMEVLCRTRLCCHVQAMLSRDAHVATPVGQSRCEAARSAPFKGYRRICLESATTWGKKWRKEFTWRPMSTNSTVLRAHWQVNCVKSLKTCRSIMTFSFPILPDFVVKHYLAVAPSKKSQLKAGYAAHITKYVCYRAFQLPEWSARSSVVPWWGWSEPFFLFCSPWVEKATSPPVPSCWGCCTSRGSQQETQPSHTLSLPRNSFLHPWWGPLCWQLQWATIVLLHVPVQCGGGGCVFVVSGFTLSVQ